MLRHYELSIEEREAAPVTLEAFQDLLEWYSMGDEERPGMSPPLCLGRDIRAKFGEAGFPIYRDLMYTYEPPLLTEDLLGPSDPRTPVTTEQYETGLVENWQELDRPHHWTDWLIIDAMSHAQDNGWEVGGDEVCIRSTEAILDDLAKRSGAKRATITAEAKAREAIEIAEIEAAADAEFAVYEAWLAAGEPADDPLAADHVVRKRRISQFQIQAEYDELSAWMNEQYGLNEIGDEVASDDPAWLTHLKRNDEIEAEYKAKIALWEARYGGFDTIRHLFLLDKKCPPGTRIWDMDRNQTAPNVPTEILENYKRQSEQYAAAMMGPLPDHPELPIHQAEALSRFWAHLPSGKMIYEGTRELWSAASLDKHVGRVKDAMNANGPGMLASTFLSQFRGVQSMGWDPSEPMIIEGRVLTQEGWIRCAGDRTFNRYVPSDIKPVKGDVSKWLDHIRFIYAAEADHIVNWCAHRVQRPGDKVNHALVFLGAAGIGKDTAIEPVATAIGRHNFASITAQNFFKSEFNGYLKSVMLRIDEVHDLGGESKYAFHDRTKPVIAAPPTVHHINEKFIPHYTAKNVCSVILTSNHRDALYLSPDDRRHFVCLSSKRKEDFRPGYFDEMHSWFENGGNEAVAHYLANLDISGFNAKAPPPQTEGWHMLVGAGLAPESGDLADLIETLGKPPALTLATLRARMPGDSQLRMLFEDPKMRKVIPKRLAECGYVAVANPEARDSGGRWRMIGGKTTIYARQDLSEGEQLSAARSLSTTSPMPPVPPPPC